MFLLLVSHDCGDPAAACGIAPPAAHMLPLTNNPPYWATARQIFNRFSSSFTRLFDRPSRPSAVSIHIGDRAHSFLSRHSARHRLIRFGPCTTSCDKRGGNGLSTSTTFGPASAIDS